VDRQWLPYPYGQAAVWLDDTTLLASIEDRGDVHLWTVGLPDGRCERLVAGARTITGYDAAGGTIAFAAAEPHRPAEVFAVVGGVERRLTHHTEAFCAATSPRPATQFTVGTHEVDVWMYTPADLDPATAPPASYPCLLSVHGGPFTQYGNTFFDEAQFYASAGFVVLMANPRGGSGREEAWGAAIRGPKHPVDPGDGWGSVDYDDLMAVVDHAIATFAFIDPDRLGMLGGSYGGYMATWMAGHTDRFRALCSERAVNNLLNLETMSDFAGAFRAEVGVSHLDDPAEYLRMSPITYVRDITSPMLILHSEEDLRCPIGQADELFVALRLLGKEVEYHRFPAESHELSRSGSPAHRIQRAELIVEYFTRHLAPE
jgi:dipeptidyl aminopeptidase/acylaminoacyl peptidase